MDGAKAARPLEAAAAAEGVLVEVAVADGPLWPLEEAAFDLGATRWQVLSQIRLPSALPYLLSAMKISGGLALIGTVVAEFVAGSGASMGLAWRIMESGNRLQIAKMFAALLLLSLLGIAIFFCLSALENLLLRRWHESRVVREI